MIGTSWKKFSALIPAAALVFLDQTILPVALPEIQKEMGASDTALQWCVNSYFLAIAVFVLVGGKLSDMMGHKKAFFVGILGFVLSSIACSLSKTVGMLIGARALQGVSAAFIFPAQTAMISLIFPPEKRGKGIGMIVSISSLFFILGPLVGGYLIKVATWHWIFWMNVPIGLFGLWLIFAFLPTPEKTKGKVDLLGFLFFAVGISALTVVFMQAADWGWSSERVGVFSAVAIIALILLLIREKWAQHPFLDLALFKHTAFASVTMNITMIQFFMMISVFRTIYFQDTLGFTPFFTGLIMFISTFPLLFVALIAGYLSDQISPKLPIALGYLLLIFSCFWFGFFSTPGQIGLILVLIAFGTGIPLIFTPSYSTALHSVPKTKVGSATGIITTLRMTSGTVGLALIHLFVTTVQDRYRPIQGQRVASITSFSYVHFALAFLLILSFSIAFILHSRKSAHHMPDTPAEGWD